MGLGVHCSSNAFTPMITGQELIAFVKANPEMDQSELAHAAGFTRIDKNGKERIYSNVPFGGYQAANQSAADTPPATSTASAPGVNVAGKADDNFDDL